MPAPQAEVRQYDPALAEAAREGETDDVVAIIARVSDPSSLPPGATVITRFGDIVTLRIRRSQIAELAEHTGVVDMEASRYVLPTDDDFADTELEDDIEAEASTDGVAADTPYTRRPAGLSGTGRGACVAVLDWGCDICHPAFRKRDGSTRLLALWDQRGNTASGDGNRWGYGRIFSAADINAALKTDDPYKALAYHPGDADPPDPSSRVRSGAHGTHVMSIAAGSAHHREMSGVAADSDLIFVHLARTTDPLGRGNLGDSASVLEALEFAFSTAGPRACVANMSIGAHGGPHDGSTLVEQGIDRALWVARGVGAGSRAVTNSSGNYAASSASRHGRLRVGEEHSLHFRMPANDSTPSELEVWYPGSDRIIAAIIGPDGKTLATVGPGAESALSIEGKIVGHVYHVRSAGNGDHHLDLFLRPRAPGGTWAIRLKGEHIVDGRYFSWIERERGLRPRFVERPGDETPFISPRSTTGSLCNGRLSITVGAYDPHVASRRIGRFSSAGPCRDGRRKPELLAPGVSIRAARSAAHGEAPGARYSVKSGTSMAAPHVAGAIAVLFETLGSQVDILDLRAILFATTERASIEEGTSPDSDVHRFGNGYLDLAAAERLARRWSHDDGKSEDNVREESASEYWYDARGVEPEHEPSSYADRLLDLTEGGQVQSSEDLLTSALAIAGIGPGEPLYLVASLATAFQDRPQAGDVLVRSTPGEGIRYSGVVLSSEPEPSFALERRGVEVEMAGPGSYVEVVEVGPDSTVRRMGRRLTDSFGRVPRGQALYRAGTGKVEP